MLRAELIQDIDADDRREWSNRFSDFADRLAYCLLRHKRCAALYLAYSLADDAGRSSEALRSFFRDAREYIVKLIGQGMAENQTRELVEDSIAALERATLWLALEGGPRPLVRAAEQIKDRVSR